MTDRPKPRLKLTEAAQLTGLSTWAILKRIKRGTFPPSCAVTRLGQRLWDRDQVVECCGVSEGQPSRIP